MNLLKNKIKYPIPGGERLHAGPGDRGVRPDRPAHAHSLQGEDLLHQRGVREQVGASSEGVRQVEVSETIFLKNEEYILL